MRSILLRTLLRAGLLGLPPLFGGVPAAAEVIQTSEEDSNGIAVPPAASIEEGDRLRDLLRPRDALAAYERALAGDPENFQALWKAAREAVHVGMLAPEEPGRWYLRAEEHARRAVAARPRAVQGHSWLAVALGRRAMEEGVRTRVRLSEAVRDEAMIALELDSLDPVAHHVLGQWHAEVRRLSGFERFVATKIMGGDALERASGEEARSHLERAVHLAPEGLIHRLELARVYRDLGEGDLARQQLQEVIERPALVATDPLHKQEAQEMLQDGG